MFDGQKYTALRQEIGRLLESEHSVSRQAVEQERVRAYWEVGQRLHQVLPAPKGRGAARRLPRGHGLLPPAAVCPWPLPASHCGLDPLFQEVFLC